MKIRIKEILENYYKFPLFILTHPLNGFEQMKRYKKGKMSVSLVLLFLACLLSILNYQYLGFLVNNNNPQNLNSVRILSTLVFFVLLFAIGNWSITTLLDGKGKFRDIFMMICYSFFPLILIGYPNLLLSHMYTGNEVSFYYIALGISEFLMGFMIFTGLLVVHEYTLFRTILTVIVTAVAMSVIVFIILLMFNLVQQILGFLYTLYQEITWRYF